jgi:acetyl-CoA acetyltransferase family protein
VPALTVNRLCGSGFEAIVQGAHRILLGEAKTVLAGGMENMSQAPHVIRGARKGLRLGQGQLEDSLMVALLDSYCNLYMAQTSDRVATKYGVTRAEQDAYALSSQQRAAAAWAACRLSEEVVPVEVKVGRKTVRVEKDDHMRADSTLEALAALPPSFAEEGGVTAGNASGIVDGAAAVVVTSAANAKAKGRKPLGRLVSWAVVGVEPELMGIGPAPAARAAIAKADLKQEDIGLWEINEAFAGQILGVVRELSLDREKLNVNGGAIALGHPLAATGTRCTLTLLKEMRRRGVRYGLAGACIGGGQGIAVVVEAAV